MRNRDAHKYAVNVRSSQFYLVERVFIRAFNILLASVGQSLPGGNS
jgi:hypothetical protein